MTILFFARRFYPLIGGVEKHVLEISKILVSKGHKVIVISETPPGSHSTAYQSDSSSARPAGKLKNLESYNINPGKDDWFKKFRIWRQLWKHRDLIRSANVVHCHDVFFWYLPFRFLFPSKKVYTTFHGYEGNNIPNKNAIFMHKVSEKLSNGNICIGEFLKKWYGTKPTFITYGAVNINNQEAEIRKQKSKKNMIVFVGRLEEETGIMEYLKAFEIIVKKYPSLKLEVLGDGSLMKEAETFVSKNKLNVKFHGFVENTAEFVERATFVFVSRYLGVLESLMSKKYVLAVYNNEIKKDYLEMSSFANFISISKDSDGIKDELDKYLSNEKLKNFKIKKGYEWVKDKTWENMVNLYLKLWNLS